MEIKVTEKDGLERNEIMMMMMIMIIIISIINEDQNISSP